MLPPQSRRGILFYVSNAGWSDDANKVSDLLANCADEPIQIPYRA